MTKTGKTLSPQTLGTGRRTKGLAVMTSLLSLVLTLVLLAGCQGGIRKEASYPTRPDGAQSSDIIYSDQKQQTIWGDGKTLGDKLLGKGDDGAQTTGIGVNSFLWRASLDTIAFMPLQSADPFGGVILTDWYENPETPGERFKISVFILDQQLRADGVRVAVFKQRMERNSWRDDAVATDIADKIETAILTRARELRVAQSAAAKAK